MEICHHNILKSEIVGIGPLMIKQSPDQATNAVYKPRQLSFLLHLKNQSVLIESDWFYLDEPTGKAGLKEFQQQYNDAATVIKLLISSNENS